MNLPRNRLVAMLLVLLCCGSMATPLHAAEEVLKELPNAKDAPLIGRLAGSTIVGYSQKGFDDAVFPLTNEVSDKKFVKGQTFEGKVTQVAYLAPAGKSRLEVQRSYEEALNKAGFARKFACGADACGRGTRIVEPFIDRARTIRSMGYGGYSGLAFMIVNTDEPHYLWGTIRANGQDNAVSILVSTMAASDSSPLHERIGVLVTVVEPKPMESGQVTVDVKGLQTGLAADGKIALYGIYFDTGKADVKPESKPQLDEMAKLLTADKALRVVIVGHTDNQGTIDGNVALSQKRAEAIVAALVKDYRIDGKRLLAKRVASFAPVASNESEDGRAKNRRVELVRQ